QVAVVAEGDAAARLGGLERRLGVLPAAAPGGGVAAMADGDMTLQRREHLLVEDLGHQPEVFEDDDLRAVGHRDTSGFLAAVLRGVEAVVGELADFFTSRPNPEHAAFLTRLLLRKLGVCGGHSHCSCANGGNRSRPVYGRSVRAGALRAASVVHIT